MSTAYINTAPVLTPEGAVSDIQVHDEIDELNGRSMGALVLVDTEVAPGAAEQQDGTAVPEASVAAASLKNQLTSTRRLRNTKRFSGKLLTEEIAPEDTEAFHAFMNDFGFPLYMEARQGHGSSAVTESSCMVVELYLAGHTGVEINMKRAQRQPIATTVNKFADLVHKTHSRDKLDAEFVDFKHHHGYPDKPETPSPDTPGESKLGMRLQASELAGDALEKLKETMGEFDDTASVWDKWALCKLVDAEVFFPEKPNRHTTAAAKQVCMSCDVRENCLTKALENGENWGVWGGLSERERRKLLKHHGA